MLTSSDAKWRCMWHMLVWSIVMTLVSQFFDMLDFLAFFAAAAATVIILPVLTAIYSNTSGQKGRSLIRVGYVFCDPVMACITVVPSLILNHLPKVLDEYHCIKNYPERNQTLECIGNLSDTERYHKYATMNPWNVDELIGNKEQEFLLIQMAMVTPILLALAMGQRTQKMRVNTQLLIFAYWFITSLDAIELLETAMLSKHYKHVIFTTEAIVFIAMIISNSYAVVTLCSYMSPKDDDELCSVRYSKKFDFVYQALMASVAIFFCEIPMLVARFQILFTDLNRIVVGTFILWIIKNLIFIALIFISVFLVKLRKSFSRMKCQPMLDGDKAFFKPEKRDVYIYSHQYTQARRSALKKESPTETTPLGKRQKRVTFLMDDRRKLGLSTIEEGAEVCSAV